MKTLIVTNMYPNSHVPYYGMVVREEVDCLEKGGIQTEVLFINGRLNRWNYFKKMWALLRLLSKNEYDIIHAHHTYCGLMVIVALRLLRKKIPLVLSLHEGEIFHKGKITYRMDLIKRLKYVKSIKEFVISRVDFLITVNGQLVKGLPPDKYSVVPNGVNLKLFKPLPRDECRKQLGINNGGRIIFFPSDNLRPEKRFDLAHQAYALLKNADIEDVILLYGNSIRYEQMPLYYNASDVILLTSDYEASPMVIKEAMAVNAPVVSVDAGDARQMIEGIAGCFLASRDFKDIARKIKMAFDFNSKTDARERIINLELSQEQAVSKIVRIYEKFLSKNKSYDN